MECKKCANLNFLISQGKHEDAVSLINDYLVLFQKESIVPFEHTAFQYLCKSCFNLYKSDLKSENYNHTFKVDKFSTHDGEMLKHIAYSFTLFNLAQKYTEYLSKFGTFDFYFSAESLIGLYDNFSSVNSGEEDSSYTIIDVIRLLGLNADEHPFKPKLYPSYEDLLTSLPQKANLLQKHVLFKISLSPKDVSCYVDFSAFPKTDIAFESNEKIKPIEISVLNEHGELLGDAANFDFKTYLHDRDVSFGNFLSIAIKDAFKNYKGEPFNYNADPKPYLDELVLKYLK